VLELGGDHLPPSGAGIRTFRPGYGARGVVAEASAGRIPRPLVMVCYAVVLHTVARAGAQRNRGMLGPVATDLVRHLRDLPPVQLVYTDFDGTLLGPYGSLLIGPDGRPSARAATALVAARTAGITVVPVSGRRQALLAGDARLLGVRDYIAEAGTVVCRRGEVSFVWGDAPADLAGTPREAVRDSGALAALLAAFPDDLRLYHPWDEGRVGEYLLHGLVDVAVADRVLSGAGAPWARLVDNGAAHGWPGRSVRAYHLLPRGTGKAQAVTTDLAARGVAPSAALAVGDSLEDATMALVVGTYVQVANGHAEVGGNAFRARGAMGDGFADAIDAVLAARG
jgi:hydroxymethylpyrimidine pyrophosphatase-like HAD family hydrolase